jgi:hypothetical protein
VRRIAVLFGRGRHSFVKLPVGLNRLVIGQNVNRHRAEHQQDHEPSPPILMQRAFRAATVVVIVVIVRVFIHGLGSLLARAFDMVKLAY